MDIKIVETFGKSIDKYLILRKFFIGMYHMYQFIVLEMLNSLINLLEK